MTDQCPDSKPPAKASPCEEEEDVERQAAAVALGMEREQLLDQILFDGEEVDQADEGFPDAGGKSIAASGRSQTSRPPKETQESGSLKKMQKKTNAREEAINRKCAAGVSVADAQTSSVPAVAVGIREEDMGSAKAAAMPSPVEAADPDLNKANESEGSSLSAEQWAGIPGAVAISNSSREEAIRRSIQEDLEQFQDLEANFGGGSARTTVTAVTVDEDIAEMEQRVRAELEQKIRNSILQNVVEASAVVQTPKTRTTRFAFTDKRYLVGCFALLLLCVGIALAVIYGITTGDSASESVKGAAPLTTLPPSNPSTLDDVRERGYVRCGLYEDAPGLSSFNEQTQLLEGFNVDQCRAISIAVFGSPDKVELVPVNSGNRFWMLANRSVDVLTQTVTHTMGRDVYESSAEAGFTFTTPYFYSGVAFGGLPDMVSCAESYASGTEPEMNCDQLKVCVTFGTTHVSNTKRLLPESISVVTTVSIPDAVNKFAYGRCNVFVAEPISMAEEELRSKGYSGAYKVGHKLFSREPLALVTNDGEPEWSALVNTVVNVFFFAEAMGMTRSNANDALDEANDSDLIMLASLIVSELGNYGEMYETYIEDVIPRTGVNTLYQNEGLGTTGLLYSMPYGDLDTTGPPPALSESLGAILSRGHVRCGVKSRPGFAEHVNGIWSGFDVDMCRGIAAALFGQTEDHIVFEDLAGTGSDYYSLINDDVDIVAGSLVTLDAVYKESTTGHAYSFSPSYFYDSSGHSYAMATIGKESQWSDFVYWVVMTTIYAEENGVGQDSLDLVPLVDLFGNDLQSMLRNTVNATGPYSDVYARSLEQSLPRSGKNQVNMGQFKGSQQYPMPLI